MAEQTAGASRTSPAFSERFLSLSESSSPVSWSVWVRTSADGAHAGARRRGPQSLVSLRTRAKRTDSNLTRVCFALLVCPKMRIFTSHVRSGSSLPRQDALCEYVRASEAEAVPCDDFGSDMLALFECVLLSGRSAPLAKAAAKDSIRGKRRGTFVRRCAEEGPFFFQPPNRERGTAFFLKKLSKDIMPASLLKTGKLGDFSKFGPGPRSASL